MNYVIDTHAPPWFLTALENLWPLAGIYPI